MDEEADIPEYHSTTQMGKIISKINSMLKKPSLDSDLSGVLDIFIAKLRESDDYLANGIMETNFAEAALIIQGASVLFSKRMDLLWNAFNQYQMRIILYDEKNKDSDEVKKLEDRERRKYNRLKKLEEKRKRVEEERQRLAEERAKVTEEERQRESATNVVTAPSEGTPTASNEVRVPETAEQNRGLGDPTREPTDATRGPTEGPIIENATPSEGLMNFLNFHNNNVNKDKFISRYDDYDAQNDDVYLFLSKYRSFIFGENCPDDAFACRVDQSEFRCEIQKFVYRMKQKNVPYDSWTDFNFSHFRDTRLLPEFLEKRNITIWKLFLDEKLRREFNNLARSYHPNPADSNFLRHIALAFKYAFCQLADERRSSSSNEENVTNIEGSVKNQEIPPSAENENQDDPELSNLNENSDHSYAVSNPVLRPTSSNSVDLNSNIEKTLNFESVSEKPALTREDVMKICFGRPEVRVVNYTIEELVELAENNGFTCSNYAPPTWTRRDSGFYEEIEKLRRSSSSRTGPVEESHAESVEDARISTINLTKYTIDELADVAMKAGLGCSSWCPAVSEHDSAFFEEDRNDFHDDDEEIADKSENIGEIENSENIEETLPQIGIPQAEENCNEKLEKERLEKREKERLEKREKERLEKREKERLEKRMENRVQTRSVIRDDDSWVIKRIERFNEETGEIFIRVDYNKAVKTLVMQTKDDSSKNEIGSDEVITKRRRISLNILKKLKSVDFEQFERFFTRNYVPEEDEGHIESEDHELNIAGSTYPVSSTPINEDRRRCSEMSQESSRDHDSGIFTQTSDDHFSDALETPDAHLDDATFFRPTPLRESPIGRRRLFTDMKRYHSFSSEKLDAIFQSVDRDRWLSEMDRLSMKVDAWQEFISERIPKSGREEDFDIHQYGANIMDSIVSERPTKFGDIVRGKGSAEVVRHFVSVLQLANTENVEISGVRSGQLSNDTFSLKLISKERYHEKLGDFVAPSEQTFQERLKKVRCLKRNRTNDVNSIPGTSGISAKISRTH